MVNGSALQEVNKAAVLKPKCRMLPTHLKISLHTKLLNGRIDVYLEIHKF